MAGRFAIGAAALAAVMAACVGSITGEEPPAEPGAGAPAASAPGDEGRPAAVPAPGATPAAACPATTSVGPTPLRRLTRVEYRNTIADLLGVKTLSDADLPDDATD